MSPSKNSRQDFEAHFLEFYPNGNLTRNDHGRYVNKTAHFEWAAYRKAVQRIRVKLNEAEYNTERSLYVIGRITPGVRVDPDNPESGKMESIVFSKYPRRHRSLIKAEAERQRLIFDKGDQGFTLFLSVAASEEVKNQATVHAHEKISMDIKQKSLDIETELVHIRTEMAKAHKDKDENILSNVLSILDRRFVTLMDERDALIIEQNKLNQQH